MLRAQGAIGIVEGGSPTQTGYAPADMAYGADVAADVYGPFGKGTVGRRMLIIWGASAVWLLLVWRAIEGY